MAKTQYSFSHDAKLRGDPSGERLRDRTPSESGLTSGPRIYYPDPRGAHVCGCWFFRPNSRGASCVEDWMSELLKYFHAQDMQTMPGLGTRPGFWEVDLDENGRVTGLF